VSERSKRPAASKGAALSTYAKKRDFAQTPEPSGASGTRKASRGKAPRFVVQMHRATRLHWDFRLEADGVLKSWAVPKGPSLDPGEKRLAMQVEDHPLDYRDFEGVIPAGNYGAGEVIVWDRGTYRLLEGTSASEQIAKGALKFELSGQKLRGGFALVHIKKPRDGEANAWLLIKERDPESDPDWKIGDHAQSVKSGQTLADIAKDPGAPHWSSDRPASSAATERRPPRKLAPPPTDVAPMLATPLGEPFDDPEWLFELKWDGYRALVRIDREGKLSVTSRNGNDFLAKFPELAELSESFSERPVIVDGELVVLDEQGRSSFQGLQERLDRYGRRGEGKRPITFVAFDLLYGNGRDVRGEPLEVRKAALESLLTGRGPVMFSKHVAGDGTKLFAFAREHGLEGVVAKRRTSVYQTRRSREWLKIKVHARQEFVVGGWTEARGSRKHFGALLLGVYRDGELQYAGSVGTGFDERKLASIAAKLAPLSRETSPFTSAPKTDTPAHWVSPELVAEIAFGEWTRDGLLRQPVFLGLRGDKDPRTVTRERPKHAKDVA
jgi:bifunctional non-homologous end joining protein LigD